jgi:aminomuconate-semialdehyde/2-hydroxymuconate-6-semialdehyde dehydrogenase
MEVILNYINGSFQPPADNKFLDNYEPATGRVYGKIPDSGAVDVEMAVSAAEQAFASWSGLPDEERSRWLLKIADGIESRLEAFAAAESKDNGKPVFLARTVDIPRAVSNFRFFAHAATQFGSESFFMPGEGVNYTLRRPLGAVACISPWNLPLYLFTWKIAPALAAGNTVVAKPSEITPLTAFMLSEVCRDINFPAGVLNIVHGLGPSVGEPLCLHEGIHAISFTGGTATGQRIAAIAAPRFKKLSLELGGKNPNIIFADCDYDQMLSTTLRSSFANQGQICLCGSRIFVERPLYEKFRSDFTQKVAAMKVGDPADEGTRTGAVVSEQHMEKVLSYIQLAKDEGGTLLAGGQRVRPAGRCENGWFIQPAVIEGLDYNCRTNQEEIFGPVVTIMPFDTEEEVLMYANSTKYGLAATLWTSDLKRAHRMAEKLETGIVWVNCWLVRDLRTPFGGTKQSGIGREGGMEAMQFFTEAKNVCIVY